MPARNQRRKVRLPETQPVFEQIATEATQSFVWRLDDYPWRRNFWNVHPQYEIHLIRNASGVAFVGDYIGRFEPGYLAAVGGGLPHDWVTQTAPGETIRGRDIVLQFDADRLRQGAACLPELNEIGPFLTLASRGLVYRGSTRSNCAQMLEEIGDAHGIERLTLFLRLLQSLSRSTEYEVLSSEGFRPTIDASEIDIIQRTLTYLIHNASRRIRLSEVAALAGMSETAFSRFFKKNTGNSFSDHVAEVRIGRACRLLADSDLPITVICFDVGYQNVSNFNRSFLTHRGSTPSAYRRLARQRRC